MAIQIRRGAVTDFDSTKMVSGELAVSTDGSHKVWATGAAGDCWELVDKEDVTQVEQDIAPAYSASSTYAVGAYVMYNGVLYRCTTAIATAEAWTAAHWTAVNVGSELTHYKQDISENFYYDATKTKLFKSNSTDWTVKTGCYAGQSGWIASNTYDSYYFTASVNGSVYVDDGGTSYFQLCVYPSGDFNDPQYVRYRNIDHNLPTKQNPLIITAGTMLIVSTIPNDPAMYLALVYIGQDIKVNKFHLKYDDGVLTVDGFGINCFFSDATFTAASGGLFELQNLIYNNITIFGTNNDYIGPVTIAGGDIIGAKHGGETTNSVKIVANGGELQDGDETYADAFFVYVTSTITDTFDRVSIWSFNRGVMTTSSYLTTLKDEIVATVFGAGIISSEDSATIAWLNYKPLSAADTSNKLTEETTIVTTAGTLVSRRTSNVSDYGVHPIYFLIYTGRKKLYYYNTFGNGDTVPTGTTFASTAELEFH